MIFDNNIVLKAVSNVFSIHKSRNLPTDPNNSRNYFSIPDANDNPITHMVIQTVTMQCNNSPSPEYLTKTIFNKTVGEENLIKYNTNKLNVYFQQ